MRYSSIAVAALTTLPLVLGTASASLSSPVMPAGETTPHWVPRATCQPSAEAADRARSELTEQRTNFDTVDAFATKVEKTEKARSNTHYGGTYWQDEETGLVVQLSGTGNDDANRILDLAAQENFPYPVSFTRALSLTERQAIADKIRTNGIDGHPVQHVSTTDMCHDVTVTIDPSQSTKPLTSTRTNELTNQAEERYDAKVLVYRPFQAQSSRRDESGATNGGAALRLASQSASVYRTPECTAGFRAIRNSVQVMVTAGHCSGSGTAWYSLGNSRYLGTTTYSGVVDRPSAATRADVGVMAYGSSGYGTSIWYGGPYADELRSVTAKGSYPTAGTPVWVNGARTGRVPAKIQNNSTTVTMAMGSDQWSSPVATVWYPTSEYAQPGDSGGPVVKGNEATSSTTDLKALGTWSATLQRQDGTRIGAYTRVNTLEQFGGLSISTS